MGFGILDCGEVSCEVGLESTVIKMDEENHRVIILRLGGITKKMMMDVIKDDGINIVYSKHIKKEKNNTNVESEIVEAPGMKYRHYAPKKPLYLVQDADLFVDIWWFYKMRKEIDHV